MESAEAKLTLEQRARKMIRATGERVTQPRLRTLQALLAQDRALSHGELRACLPDMDRVSLYRSLEWLIGLALVFRIDDDGKRLYGICHHRGASFHPHFRCTSCGLTRCLQMPQAPPVDLPKDFQLHDVELLVKGLCDSCAAAST